MKVSEKFAGVSMRAYRNALIMSVALPFAALANSDLAFAQASDLGSVTVAAAPKPVASRKPKQKPRATNTNASQTNRNRAARTAAPVVAATALLSSDAAIGRNAPAGSAPALAVSQSSLNAFEPVSIVSDKTIRDISKPGGDYNETAKFTPGFVNSSPNYIGDTKSGWRGYSDGQFNITFDGIPFGDANDPTHHSSAYFPSAFLGRVTIDRGPGAASQVGYATFGGTMGLGSLALEDKAGASLSSNFGSFNTFTNSASVQSGYSAQNETRALAAVSTVTSNGAIQYGASQTYQALLKVEKKFGDVKITALATGGTEHYNNVNAITWPQYMAYGKSYGQVNGNPLSQQFVGYNNSLKATDMEYIRADWDLGGFKFDNTAYTYAYWYPNNQNNGNDQTLEYNGTAASAGTVTSVKYPGQAPQNTYVYGLTPGDVTGYIKFNNYRAYGDIFNVSRDINAPFINGTLKAGVWVERVGNERMQQYIDYTTGAIYPSINPAAPNQASFKLLLTSYITNVQPFVEYEWRVTDKLTLTPGYKFESFNRDHEAAVNQTTLLPMNYSHTYTKNLPFFAARYKLTNEVTLYAQASKGFLAPTVSAYYVVNPDLNGVAPQDTTNYQAGVVFKNATWTFSADVYQVTATNFPITTTVGGLTTYQNGGKAQYQGIEAEGTYALGNGLAAYASGALIGAKFVEGQFNGLRVGSAPSFTLAGGLIYDDQTYFASLLHKMVGDGYGSSGQKVQTATTNATLNRISGYDSTDFVAGIRSDVLKRMGFGQKAEFKVGVSNIFDHRNITDISGDPTGQLSIVNTKLSYSFMVGRTVFGGVKVDF